LGEKWIALKFDVLEIGDWIGPLFYWILYTVVYREALHCREEENYEVVCYWCGIVLYAGQISEIAIDMLS